jgi:hypothetical protein
MRTNDMEERITVILREESSARMLQVLRWLIFYPEGGSDTFLQNVGSHTDYMALYPEDISIHIIPLTN